MFPSKSFILSYKPYTDICNTVANFKKANSPIDYKFMAEIYPNPSFNKIKVHTNYSGKIYLSITDVQGKNYTFKKLGSDNREFELETNLSTGIYFLTITNEDNEKIIKKLLIK